METMMVDAKPNCLHERVAADLSDEKERNIFFEQVKNRGKNILIVAEGLMGYLSEAEAAEFATALYQIKKFKRWIIDLMSPGILPLIQQEMGTLLEDAGTPLKFAPAEGELFFKPYGWNLIQSKSKLKTAALLNRLSLEMLTYATYPEPDGLRGNFPWSGVSLFENTGVD